MHILSTLLLALWCVSAFCSVPARDPKKVAAYHELKSASKVKPNKIDDYENPPGTLGHIEAQTFTVPPKLKPRVDFWMRIFTEFASHQAVLHDADIPNLIYKVVDLAPVLNRSFPSYRHRQGAIEALIQNEKENLARQALSIQRTKKQLQNNLPPFAVFRKLQGEDSDEAVTRIANRIRSQIGQRDRFVRGYLTGGKYFDEMENIFENQRVPKELTRLPLIESSFNIDARSHVGASGIWQFMKETGKQFLRIDRYVDERNDPIAATKAAAKFLRSNYKMLGSWPLAITAYNHGPYGMANAVRETGSADLAHIIENYEGRAFGFASSNFYAEFLAILEIEREYRRYFGHLRVDAPLKYKELRLSKSTRFRNVAGACGISTDTLWDYNPALTSSVTQGAYPVPKGYPIKVPANRSMRCQGKLVLAKQ